ncbi:integrase core domain-containing protein [Labrenzia sp. OB1]|nr:integrase core domain-containing protein [Labrenzia sp. OB1]
MAKSWACPDLGQHYNTKRPHRALGYRPPAPESIVQMDQTR